MRTKFLAAVLVCWAVPAAAVTIDFSPRITHRQTWDDNLFRRVEGVQVERDTIGDSGVGANLVLQQSLQRVTIDAEARRLRYEEHPELNHTRSRARANVLLQTQSFLQLDTELQYLREFENFAFRPDSGQSFYTQRSAHPVLALAVTPHWSLLAGGEWMSRVSSLSARADLDVREQSAEAGLRWRGAFTRSDLLLRRTDGEFPNRLGQAIPGVEEQYQQDSVIWRNAYRPSPLNNLNLELGYTRRTHPEQPDIEDFSGTLGRLSWELSPSARTQLRFEASRGLYYVQLQGANFLENRGVAVGAAWQATPMLRAIIDARRDDQNYQGGTQDGRTDTLSVAAVGLEYTPFYRATLSADYRWEQRDSPVLDQNFLSRTVGVRFTYRYGDAVPYQLVP